MESATNLRPQQYHLQDQLSSSSSSSSSSLCIPTGFVLGNSHVWTPNIALNTCNLNPIRDSGQKSSTSPVSSSMVQDLGFQWTNSGSFFSHDPNAGKLKEEIISVESLPISTDHNVPPSEYLNDLSHKLLIKTLISSGCQINGIQMKSSEFYPAGAGSAASRNAGNFSQIYPSVNVSNWNVWNTNTNTNTPSFSNSLDLNLQAPGVGMYKESLPYSLQEQIPQPSIQCIPSNKMTAFSSEVTEPKRTCNSIEPRVNQIHPPKKTRVEPRASCPPFKVRKERLGDRIAALQQLVAPFGKTDTASVLMEAIGYIKFLQNQVETLSVPYMKSSSNKTRKPTHRRSAEDASEEPNRELRSRGLCLVPLGCLSYVTGDVGGGAIWPPPGYNGGTS